MSVNKGIHDQFFKKLMSRPEVAKGFFMKYLPKDILNVIDIDAIELRSGTFVSNAYKSLMADIVYEAKMGDGKAYLSLLIEHQSSPDPLMPFRIIEYTTQIMRQHIDSHQGVKKLPFVFPLVIYHGITPYRYSTSISDIINAPKSLIETYLFKPFTLLDLSKVNTSSFNDTLLADIMLMALKHIYKPDIKAIIDLLRILAGNYFGDKFELKAVVIQYIISARNSQDREALIDTVSRSVSKDMGEAMTTIAESLIQEGLQKGLQKGLQEGMLARTRQIAEKMLSETHDYDFVARVTGLSVSELKALEAVNH